MWYQVLRNATKELCNVMEDGLMFMQKCAKLFGFCIAPSLFCKVSIQKHVKYWDVGLPFPSRHELCFSVPHNQRIMKWKKNYAHVIPDSTERSQGVV